MMTCPGEHVPMTDSPIRNGDAFRRSIRAVVACGEAAGYVGLQAKEAADAAAASGTVHRPGKADQGGEARDEERLRRERPRRGIECQVCGAAAGPCLCKNGGLHALPDVDPRMEGQYGGGRHGHVVQGKYLAARFLQKVIASAPPESDHVNTNPLRTKNRATPT